MTEQDLDKAAGELLLTIMEEMGCAPQGIEAVGFAVDSRTLDIALSRAEYWIGLVEGVVPPADSLRTIAAYLPR